MSKRSDAMADLYSSFRANPSRDRKALMANMYVRLLTELAANRFKWQGLPSTIDERFLELQLFRRGLCIFYYDRDYERFLAMAGTPAGRLNMYNNSTQYKVVSPIFSKTIHASPYAERAVNGEIIRDERGVAVMHVPDGVPIWSNYLRVPDWDVVEIYASKMAETDRTIEINKLAMRHPFLIACEEEQRTSMANMFRQVQEGQPVIWGTELLGATVNEKVQVFNMGISEQTLLNLSIMKSREWNECMTYLGINNSNQDKKERLVSDEVSANNSQVMSARVVALNSRQQAAERINELFGLNITVEWNEDVLETGGEPDPMMLAMAAQDSEGDDDNDEGDDK